MKAKFKCNSVEHNEWGKRAKLTAVYSTTGENADFAKATPSGELSIAIEKDVPAVNFFEPGKEYYITFDEAPAQ